MLVPAPSLPLLASGEVRQEHLTGTRFLLCEPCSQTRELPEQVLAQWGLTDVMRSDVCGPEAVKRCVEAGLGVSLISEHAVVNDVRSGSPAVVEVNPQPRSRAVTPVPPGQVAVPRGAVVHGTAP
ncbi:LysR substrate-binding domain-containing protein [Streptomyces sp. NPDC057582]|uniref:LysR substrate-binding domain-containing protein n=1 Tax=Streptomyces sp. NPDC057582 TaxID=3346174 RepID=UPI0036C5E0F6